MPSLYLVPKKGAEFPFEEVKKKIAGLPKISTTDVDFDALIQKCKDNDWPPELADKYRRLKDSGNCIEFETKGDPVYTGTVWEENVYFTFEDLAQHNACEPFIEKLARELGLEISIGFSE